VADRSYIPSSPECGQWEALLADALDGQLRQEDEAAFTGHMAICPGCTALFEEARRGREWLDFLSPEPQIPDGLLDRILAQTGPGQVAGYGLVDEGIPMAAIPQPCSSPGFAAPEFARRGRRYAESRLLMTMAMAFFSIALTLNLVGFKFTEVRLSDLRPSAVRSLLTRRIVTASIPIVRYYDHLRFLYQVELTPFEGQSEPAQQPAAPDGSGESKGIPGTGLSPYLTGAESARASAPEGLAPRPVRMPRLFSADTTGRSWARYAHSGGSEARASERSSLWTAQITRG
jgi:hypothetical protein